MIPENRISSEPILGTYNYPHNQYIWDQGDWEYGGIALSDSSLGLQYQAWSSEYKDNSIILTPQMVGDPETILTKPGIVQHSFSFDQNMRWTVAYTLANGAVEHVWYDSASAGYVTSVYNSGELSPRIILDDTRDTQRTASDNLLFYMKDGGLYMRIQRERFLIEHFLVQGDVSETLLTKVGMTNRWRLQWQFNRIFNIVNDPPPVAPVIIITTSVAAGIQNVPYSYPLAVRALNPPVVWEVDLGILPPGLRLEAGTITGIPVTIGTFRVTLRATDVNGDYDTVTLVMVINSNSED